MHTLCALPERFVHVLRTSMLKEDAMNDDPGRLKAREELNKPLFREGYVAFYGDDNLLYIRHNVTKTVSVSNNPHRPLTPLEIKRKTFLTAFLDTCSEDELIEEVLLPLFRQLGFHRITAAGHKDKALVYISAYSSVIILQTSDAICAICFQTVRAFIESSPHRDIRTIYIVNVPVTN